MTTAQVGDIIAQVSQSEKQETYRVGRISKIYHKSTNSQNVEVKYGYYYPSLKKDKKWQMRKPLNSAMKSALLNEEIDKQALQEYLAWEKEEIQKIEHNAQSVISFMENLYQNETQHVAIQYADGVYSVIKDGNGRSPLMELSKREAEWIREKGYLNGNNLLSHTGRKTYPFKYPEEQAERDYTSLDLIRYAAAIAHP